MMKFLCMSTFDNQIITPQSEYHTSSLSQARGLRVTISLPLMVRLKALTRT